MASRNGSNNGVLITGGAGYIGAPLSLRLARAGRPVTVLDSFLHDQEHIATELENAGIQLVRGDIRNSADRARALQGVSSVVHLAAIVGDPACKLDPVLSNAVNIDGTKGLVADMRTAGVRQLIFASTCSNYGRMADADVLVTEDTALAPVSLYAEQKVAIEQELLDSSLSGLDATCLRFATVYGVAPRMRFDLTVNEFTRDMWADRDLEVFGEQFWRPYVHVDDVGAAVELVLSQSTDKVAGAVFNVGSTTENYTKLGILEAIRETVDSGRVTLVRREEDPRDYRVSFDRIANELGFTPTSTVRSGVRELVSALDAGSFPDPDAQVYRNI
jgi:nucleoside-diphosphate-sugar epimerase